MAPILFHQEVEPTNLCNGEQGALEEEIPNVQAERNEDDVRLGLGHVQINGLKSSKVNGVKPKAAAAEDKANKSEDSDGTSDESKATNTETMTETSAEASTTATSEIAESEKQDEDPVEPGSECTSKDLYQSKVDDQGRFEWLDHIPEDLGNAAEDEKTAKYALLVRHTRVYNDPQKVLTIHSIVIQSPHLKTLLKRVLKGYPGIALNLKRLELTGQFESIVHRWDKLTKAIENIDDSTDAGKEMKQHGELLLKVLSPQLSETINTSRDMIDKGVITYAYLWTIFYPGSIVFYHRNGHEVALKLRSAKTGIDDKGRPCFYVKATYVDWNGTQFGLASLNIKIAKFAGTRKITSLATYPLDHHPDKEALLASLLERGTKWEALAGNHFKAYNGVGWTTAFPPKKVRVKGRIVIDGRGWQDFEPNSAVAVSSLPDPPPAETENKGSGDDDDDDFVDDLAGEEDCDCCVGLPFRLRGGIRAENDEDEKRKKLPLTTEQKIIATPTIRGYSLSNKLWLKMDVDSVSEIKFNAQAFERLVLPSQQKELILGFTESQTAYKECFDDVMEGKGRGIILLLCGPPGVGKSLTAESVAEEMKAPLFSVTAGDLGIGSCDVEDKLKAIMEMCQRWNAILLIDEADVFLEERSLHELERNKLVTIFLRMIEWYEGIMFLTTNRVNTFDKAFQSRIHISIEYPDLTVDSRKLVWDNFLSNLQQPHCVSEREVKQLSLMQMNGRQIKNVLKTAQLLARRKDGVLSHQHILTVLDVTQHLHNNNRETERSRASIFC